jgi:hypothetical protein
MPRSARGQPGGTSRRAPSTGPSVVQLGSRDLVSDDAVSIVADSLEAHREDIAGGALLSIDEAGTHVRMLPLRDSQATS